jgi:selenocysteine-specific translation elongation factor
MIVGTAGHIDHGKTSLLQALTGQTGDRRPQERERGMTIDLGYLYAELEPATRNSPTTCSPAPRALIWCCWWSRRTTA